MTKEHLLPIRTHERAVELGRKGGKSKGKSKQIGALLRHAKARGDIVGVMCKLAETTDPVEAYRFLSEQYAEQLQLLQQEGNSDKAFQKRDLLLRRLEEFCKLKFGEKHRVVNISMDMFNQQLQAWRTVRQEKYQELHNEETV